MHHFIPQRPGTVIGGGGLLRGSLGSQGEAAAKDEHQGGEEAASSGHGMGH